MDQQLQNVLCHGLERSGMDYDNEGFVTLTSLRSLTAFRQLTWRQLQNIVMTDDKRRFELRGTSVRVGPCQCQEDRIDPYRAFVSVTQRVWEEDDIGARGLRPILGRQHINIQLSFAQTRHTDKPQTLIFFDSQAMQEAGMEFYWAGEGVLRTKGREGMICPCYFHAVYTLAEMKKLEFKCRHHPDAPIWAIREQQQLEEQKRLLLLEQKWMEKKKVKKAKAKKRKLSQK